MKGFTRKLRQQIPMTNMLLLKNWALWGRRKRSDLPQGGLDISILLTNRSWSEVMESCYRCQALKLFRARFLSLGHFQCIENYIPQFLFPGVAGLKTAHTCNFSYTKLIPRPPIYKLAIKSPEKWQPAVAEKQAMCLPRPFYRGAQTRPCCLHPSGAPTHLPLSRPFH